MIYIVRHGQTEWNNIGKIQGHTDISLNEQGIKEAEILKEKLKDITFDKVYSSPLKRSYQTAEILTSNKIIIDNRLIERCNGLYEGKHKDEIFKSINFSDDIECSKYNIELEKDIQNRLTQFLKEIKPKNNNENILIVAHSGVILNIRIIVEDLIKKEKLGNCDYLVYENNKI